MASRYHYDNLNITASPTLSRMRAAVLYLIKRYVWDTSFHIKISPTRVSIEFAVDPGSVVPMDLRSEMSRAFPSDCVDNDQVLITTDESPAPARPRVPSGARVHGEEVVIDGIFVYVGRSGHLDLSKNGGYDGRLTRISTETLSKIVAWAKEGRTS